MANVQNLKPFKKGELSSEVAKKRGSLGGIAKAKKMKEEKIFKNAIAERMGFNDFEEMIDNLIKRAKNNDKSFEVLRDTLGQKPKEQIVGNMTLSYEDSLKAVSGKDDY